MLKQKTGSSIAIFANAALTSVIFLTKPPRKYLSAVNNDYWVIPSIKSLLPCLHSLSWSQGRVRGLFSVHLVLLRGRACLTSYLLLPALPPGGKLHLPVALGCEEGLELDSFGSAGAGLGEGVVVIRKKGIHLAGGDGAEMEKKCKV